MAAEIAPAPGHSGSAGFRFNEAAANGRGNLRAVVSRRPRASCFNEAAANGRGNPEACESGDLRHRLRFNEAAANGRGNRARGKRRILTRCGLQ